MKFNLIGPEILFDPSTLHKDLEISDRMDEISNPTHLTNQELKKYNGIVGISLRTDLEETVIKLSIMLNIRENIKNGSSLFEIAFLEKGQLHNDESDPTASSRYSLLGRRCYDTSKHICLVEKRNGVTYRQTEITRAEKGIYVGVITVTKRSNDVVFHFSDKEPICKLLFKVPKDHIFNEDIVPVYGLTEKHKSAKVILSVTRDAKNSATFDEMTCHKNLFTSGDGKAIANYNVGSQFKRGGIFYKVYRGALGNIAFTENSKDSPLKPVYFEVQFRFDINLRNITPNEMLFEFGLTPRNVIDEKPVPKHHPDAIIIAISRCTEKLRLCIMYWQEGKSYKTYTYLKKTKIDYFAETEEYEHFLYQFGLEIDPHEHKMMVYWIGREKDHVHDFLNISFSRPLYPVFGVTDKAFIRTKLQSKSVVTRRRSNSCV